MGAKELEMNLSTSSTGGQDGWEGSPEQDRFVYGSLLAFILIMANTLNGFTVVVFFKNRLLHTANNLLVVSLAVTDWLHVTSGCLVPLLSFIAQGNSFLQSSGQLCRAVGYGTHIFYAAATNILVLISFHRLVSIVFSQKKIVATMTAAKKVIAGLWIFTAVTCLPGVFRDGTYHYNPILKTCTILGRADSDWVFGTYSLALNFLTPLSLMMFFYLKIYKMVLHHKLSTVSESVLSSGVIEKKSKRLIIAVLGIFCSTWAPFYTSLMLTAYSAIQLPPTALIFIWPLKMSSSMSNPLLYAVCNRLYFRCMLRVVKCRGPLCNKHHQSPMSNMTHQHTCYSSSNEMKPEEISTIGPLPLPNYGPGACEHCMHCREPLVSKRTYASAFVNNGTQTSRFSNELETLPETSVTVGCRQSTCSHCTEISTSMSTRSSVPTLFQIPIQRFKRRQSRDSSAASTHVFGPTPEAQYFTDSGRSSLASQYGPTPTIHSNRTSYSSNWPNSNRTSLNSSYAQCGSTPRGSTGDLDMKRVPSFSSRQSFYSMPRSTRSSIGSSRISHYAPMSTSFSARSSLTSQYTHGSTPFGTRPNTPQNIFLNTDVEFVYLPPTGSPATNKTPSTPSTRHSSDTTLTSEKLTCRMIPDQNLDIFEDEEPPPSEDAFIRKTLSGSPASLCPSGPDLDLPLRHCSPDSTCQRVSMFLLGDMDPVDNFADLDKPREGEKFKRKRRMTKGSVFSPSPSCKAHSNENSPRQGRKVHSPRTPSPNPRQQDVNCSHGCEIAVSPIPEVETVHHCCKEQEEWGHPLINSVGKAVNLVVRARRLRSKVQPAMMPMKPDTPVPEHIISSSENKHLPHVKEPIRFVYETLYPNTYYSSYSQGQMSSTKNTLRVPGRPPPLNVPQTIQEEEVPAEASVAPSPEPPSTPRRKNASSWLAPPVIDVAQGDEDMRVECPGVLVEHHN